MSPRKKATDRYTAFYARLTDNDDESVSLENQAARFEEIRAEKGWTAKSFIEEGRHQHGDWDEKKRPKLRALLEAVKAGEVERVVARDLDRLGRGRVLADILDVFGKAGVELRDFSGHIEYRTAAGELSTTVQAAVALFELRRTGERVRESRRSWWKKGVHVGPAPYGYTSQSRLHRELRAKGMSDAEATVQAKTQIPEKPGIVIDEEEANVVREIYEMYVNRRVGARTIAQELNSRGILKRGLKWHHQTVRKVLRDPKVAGWVTFDEESYKARRRHCSIPVHKQEFRDARHESIIDRATWKKAQRILDGRGQQIRGRRQDTRCFPLSGVVTDVHGHPMKGKSQKNGQSESRWAYYTCRKRTEMGTDPDLGGCDAPSINADRAEEAVREALSQIIGSPDHVVAVYEAAKKQLAREAPGKRQEVNAIDEEIAGLERERESAFNGLRNVDLDLDSYKVIAERAQELNERIKALREKRDEAEQKVVPVKAPNLDKAQVAVFLGALRKKLSADPVKFGELVHLLHEHHDLSITVLDAYRVRVSLKLNHGDVGGKKQGRATAEVTPNIPLILTGEAGARPMTAAEWAEAENKKGHYCACGCGQRIEVKPQHHAPSEGVPRFLSGHHRMSMTEYVERLNAEGFLTVAQAAEALGTSETALRDAEDRGWAQPRRREWGNRQPMRVYRASDLPDVRRRMERAGFRFGDDEDVLTTREMAGVIGVSQTTLRYWERHGAIPAPRRDSAGRRMWRRSEVGSPQEFRESAERLLQKKAARRRDAKVTTGRMAKALGVYPSTIRRWVKNGKLPEPGRDQAGRMVWEEADIERLVREHPRLS